MRVWRFDAARAQPSASNGPEGGDGRPYFLGTWRGYLRAIRPLYSSAEAYLTMIIGIVYGAATIAIAIYMLVVLIRPEKF
jgi:hypothetical protein